MNLRALPAVLALCALSIAGCGSDSGGGVAAAPTIKITSPVPDQILRTSPVAVRGVVTPATATVQVAGREARVRDGLFDATVPLADGENVLDVIAVVDGKQPVTTSVTVTRGRTKKQIDAAIAKRRTKQRAAAEVERNTTVVPDVVGDRLDEAAVRLGDAGLGYDTVGGGVAGIVNETNWTVCDATPPAGTRVENGRSITLVVRRIC